MIQQTLFGETDTGRPLASRMRPRTLEEFAGQRHLLGEGKVLRQLIDGDRVPSMVFWGPPGVGKTTLARIIANRTKAKAEALAERIGAVVSSNEVIAREADHIFLGVKPQMIVDVLKGIAPALKARKSAPVLISMVTGPDIARIQELAGGDYPVIRIMPNMPAAVGEGVIFYACSGNCDKAQQEAFLRYMAPAGKLFPLAEELHAAGSAVAGCGPAFAAIFLESMADGGVACGLPRASAIQYAAQMMLGTAKMVLETGQHPGVLKDSVCSPAGSTIQGVQTLEKCGMRAAVFDAVTVAYEKNVELKKASD